MTVQQILKVKGDGPVITVKPGATLAEAATILSSRRIGAVVVSTDGHTMLGILSERDIVRELGKRGAACLSDPVDKVAVAEAPPAVVAAPVEIVLAPLQPDPGDAPAAATGPVPDPEAGVDSKPRRKGWWSPGR